MKRSTLVLRLPIFIILSLIAAYYTPIEDWIFFTLEKIWLILDPTIYTSKQITEAQVFGQVTCNEYAWGIYMGIKLLIWCVYFIVGWDHLGVNIIKRWLESGLDILEFTTPFKLILFLPIFLFSYFLIWYRNLELKLDK